MNLLILIRSADPAAELGNWEIMKRKTEELRCECPQRGITDEYNGKSSWEPCREGGGDCNQLCD